MSDGGWHKVPDWITLHEGISYKAKAVYDQLAARRDNQTGTVHMFHATIARLAGISVTSVKVGLKELRDIGAVTWEQRLKDDGTLTSNLYHLPESPGVGRGTPKGSGVERPPLRRVAAR